ncbi:putative bifunctional diguanylate cyclase/phosphodiesterase [Pseudomonas sp. Pseusp122]|uniref:putative bifunctional diguanylate cyclase/phosphodiesterase n=1 Tax=unclassified Pseudomonas TaxID=196821 RepID=UPI0039A6D4FE
MTLVRTQPPGIEGDDRVYMADISLHVVIFRVSIIGLFSLLCILLISSFLTAQKQAMADIRNLNTMLEARLIGSARKLKLSSTTAPSWGYDPSLPQGLANSHQAAHIKEIGDIFKQVQLGKHGIITLRTTEPVGVIIRYPDAFSAVPFAQDQIDLRIAQGDKEGFLSMNSRVDGEDRLYGFRKIGDSSLVLVTGFSPKDYLSGWYYTLSASLFFCFTLYLGVFYFIRYHRKQQYLNSQAAEDIYKVEIRSRLLVDTVGDAILCLDHLGDCTFLNRAAGDFFGVTTTEVLTKVRLNGFFDQSETTRPAGFISDVMETVRGGKACYFDMALFSHHSRGTLHVEIHAYAETNSEGIVITLRDISERHQQQDRIAFLAYHDPLTALPNRRLAKKRFAELCNEQPGCFAMLYLDIDHFKTINDSLGHIAGDELLKIIAERLVTADSRIDTVARIGGDEFLVFAIAASRESFDELIKKLLSRIAEPCTLQQYCISVTSSIGVAVSPRHGNVFGDMLKAADISLYQAKRAGRNIWRYYEESLGLREMRRMELLVDLRSALDLKQLSIHYQPQFNLETGAVVGVESLLRWNHPRKGPISPAEFIPIAEHSGLILPISYWLFDQVCQQAMIWRAMELEFNIVAVNCSAIQFHQGDIVSDIRNILLQTGLPPHMLELEITESLLIEDTERVLQVIESLKALGVKMSIDDFGTGYSSMAYLKRFPVDKIKIDQSFVRNMLVNQQDDAIVSSVIGLAHALQMNVIAEGVETFEISEALRHRGCDEAQGYFYARPAPASKIEWHLVGGGY